MLDLLKLYVSDFGTWLRITSSLISFLSLFLVISVTLRKKRIHIIDLTESLNEVLKISIILASSAVLIAVAITVVGTIIWVCLKVWDIASSDIIVDRIVNEPTAAATILAVIFTGFFGFIGIIITNYLNSLNDREQNAENERKIMEFRKTFSRGLDKRLGQFADAFEKYHVETMRAIERTESNSATTGSSKGPGESEGN